MAGRAVTFVRLSIARRIAGRVFNTALRRTARATLLAVARHLRRQAVVSLSAVEAVRFQQFDASYLEN
jgi:hypothetical protein